MEALLIERSGAGCMARPQQILNHCPDLSTMEVLLTTSDWVILALGGAMIAVGVTLCLLLVRFIRLASVQVESLLNVAQSQEQIRVYIGEYVSNRTRSTSWGGSNFVYQTLERTLRDLPTRLERALNRSFEQIPLNQYIEIANQNVTSSAQTEAEPGHREIVRELVHSLNTPLLGIESAVLTQQSMPGGDMTPALANIAGYVELCKAFLLAYKNSTSALASTDEWAPEDLKSSVQGALILYSRQLNKAVSGQVRLPGRIEGYSNNLLLAITLPLIENAVEASPENGEVTVDVLVDESVVISVTNSFVGAAPDNSIYKYGTTTKESHQGLGLPIVSRLVGSYRGGAVSHTVTGESIEFRVNLPKRLT
ncbi:HAMP domain-containing sensor histidine kinase [Dactylosporangium sp. NPDC000244]|uniref:HAMP domain-containing sensor histidine kinase n=1 Tax=Dactylosporangium sp. NPDC000244 TaxID=3154365 RepID=UPI00332DE6FD